MNHIDLLSKELKEIFQWHAARINFLSNFLIALFAVKTVNLVQIATAFSGEAQIDSNYKRLQRFFKSFKIDESSHAKVIVNFLRLSHHKWVLTLDGTNWLYGLPT